MEAKGKFDLTHAELALQAVMFALDNPSQFRRQIEEEEREPQEDSRTAADRGVGPEGAE